MVKLREYQAKQIFARHGIRIPDGQVVTTVEQAIQTAATVGLPVVLKPQLGVKGRGKVGAIAFADTSAEVEQQAQRLFALQVKGEPVERMLVEAKAAVEREWYVAVTVDYAARRPVLIASSKGGVDIEQVADENPNQIIRIPCSLLQPPDETQYLPVRELLSEQAVEAARTLYEIFVEYEAELVEINPLVVTTEGLMAVDAVLNVNEPAIDRLTELQPLAAELPAEDPLVAQARQRRWTYIDLGGDVAILSSGAGLTMTIVDLLNRQGVTPANFLDTAQFDEKGIYEAFELLRRAPTPKVWLVNIFAGLNRCDKLAEGIRQYLQDHPIAEPVVIRMVGNFEDEGHEILKACGLRPVRELEQAIDRCVRIVKEGAAQ